MWVGFIIILLLFFIEILLKPRFDKTRNGDLLIWYGKKHRTYKKIN